MVGCKYAYPWVCRPTLSPPACPYSPPAYSYPPLPATLEITRHRPPHHAFSACTSSPGLEEAYCKAETRMAREGDVFHRTRCLANPTRARHHGGTDDRQRRVRCALPTRSLVSSGIDSAARRCEYTSYLIPHDHH